METSEGGRMGVNGKEGGGECRDGAPGSSPELTVVPREGRVETAGVLSVAPAILPEGSAHNTVEPSDRGKERILKTTVV